jgi:hypothetical protein
VSEEQKDDDKSEPETSLGKEGNGNKDSSAIVQPDLSLFASEDIAKNLIKQQIGYIATQEKSMDKLSENYLKITMIDEYIKENNYKRQSSNRDYWLKVFSVVACVGFGGTLLFTGNQLGVMIIALGLGTGLGVPTDEIIASFKAVRGIESKNKGEKDEN